MTDSKFKLGDLVYFPKLGTKIYKLRLSESNSRFSLKDYFKVGTETEWYLVTENGNFFNEQDQIIFPVTEENRSMLELEYGFEFEAAESAAEEFNALGDKAKKSNSDILKYFEAESMTALEFSKAAVKISDERVKISDVAIQRYKKAVEAHVRGEALADVFADYEFSNSSGLKIVVVENGFECNCLKCKVKRIFKNMLGA